MSNLQRYGQVALENELTRLSTAVEGERNQQLYRAAYQLGRLIPTGAVSSSAAESGLTQTAQGLGLAEREIAATIKSGLTRGMANPRSLGDQPRESKPRRRPPVTAPPAVWQRRAASWVVYAQAQLAGSPGAAFLQRRGITMETARSFQLGWNPAPVAEAGTRWGQDKPIHIPQGVIFPHIVEHTVYALKVRVNLGNSGGPKWSAVRGGKTCLWGIDRVPGPAYLLLCESELDLLVAWQELRAVVAVALTGGAGKAHFPPAHEARFMQYHQVLIAFDNDAAGRQATQRWLERGSRYRALTLPRGYHDLNDLYLRGQLQAWLYEQVELADFTTVDRATLEAVLTTMAVQYAAYYEAFPTPLPAAFLTRYRAALQEYDHRYSEPQKG